MQRYQHMKAKGISKLTLAGKIRTWNRTAEVEAEKRGLGPYCEGSYVLCEIIWAYFIGEESQNFVIILRR
jgi:hypothetical protein